MSFTVAIIGRPNVGKSTLYNSISGKKTAIVHDYPGVTRDRKETYVKFLGLSFKLIDTAGYEISDDNIFARNLTKQIDFAVSDADLLLLVLDAKSGIVPDDYSFIDYVRKKNKPTILIINKSESKNTSISPNDIYKLGFKNIIHLSAEHKIGFEELFKNINPYYQAYQNIYGSSEKSYKNSTKMRIAIVGKPNVGKSTFINNLIGKQRLLASNESGTTRDSIEIPWNYKEDQMILIDTAGIRKKAKVTEKLEKLTYDDSIKAIRFANICILLLDITQKKLEKQDLIIANHIINEGRGLVIALNKADLLSKPQLEEAISEVEYQISKYITQNKTIKIYAISAKKGTHTTQVINIATKIYQTWNIRIPTANLNQWIKHTVTLHRPPLYKGKEIKLKYVIQIKSRPPTFVIMSNYPEKIPDSYIKYLKNSLADNFKLIGVDSRIIFKKNSNPYKNTQGRKTIKH